MRSVLWSTVLSVTLLLTNSACAQEKPSSRNPACLKELESKLQRLEEYRSKNWHGEAGQHRRCLEIAEKMEDLLLEPGLDCSKESYSPEIESVNRIVESWASEPGARNTWKRVPGDVPHSELVAILGRTYVGMMTLKCLQRFRDDKVEEKARKAREEN